APPGTAVPSGTMLQVRVVGSPDDRKLEFVAVVSQRLASSYCGVASPAAASACARLAARAARPRPQLSPSPRVVPGPKHAPGSGGSPLARRRTPAPAMSPTRLASDTAEAEPPAIARRGASAA